MLIVLFSVLVTVVAVTQKTDPATKQLATFKNGTTGPIGILTTEAGAPVEYQDATFSIGQNLFNNEYLVDIYQHTLRKTIPERVLHASGAGAFGYFEVTHDITYYTKAKVFSKIGKKTPVAVRFSPSFASMGVRDTIRESRGFAVKFYTEEGNLDLTAINFPMFAFKDPLLFPTVTHIMKRNPATNLPDHNMIWDFMSLRPESMNEILRILSYQGMPYGYAHMEGYAIHTFQFYNESGCSHFGRLYLSPDAGLRYFNTSEVPVIQSGDPDYYTRDLYNRISTGNYPTWTLQIQIIPESDAKKYDVDIFDPTQEITTEKYKKQPVGKLVLNENPINYYSQIELLAFSPGNVVPGVLGCLDSLCVSRRFAYRDTQNYRLGANYRKIPVNCPMNTRVENYNRDGVPPFAMYNGGNGPNYSPNSYNGPVPYKDDKRPQFLQIRESSEPRNFKQFHNFYVNLTSSQKEELIENIVEHMCPCDKEIKVRAVKVFAKINADLAKRVAKGLAADCSK